MTARLDKFPQLIKDRCEYCSGQIGQVIKEYFKTGNLSPPPQKRRSRFQEAWDWLGEWVPEWLSKPFDPVTPSPQQTRPDFSPKQSLCKFHGTNHAAQAKKFIERIQDRLQPVYKNSTRLIEQDLNEASKEMSSYVTTDLKEGLSDILEKAKERLQKDFKITLDFPELELNRDETLLPLSPDVVKSSPYFRPRTVDKPGRLAELARFFDIFKKGWGRKQIQEEHERSTIDMTDLQKAAMGQLGSFGSKMQSHAEELVRDQNKALSSHFDALTNYLEEFRGDLLDARQDKQRETYSLEERHNRIQEFLSEVRDIKHDTKSFDESLKAYDGAERPS